MGLAGTNSLASSSAPMFSQTPRATIIPPRQFPISLILSPRFLLFLIRRDLSSARTWPQRLQLLHPAGTVVLLMRRQLSSSWLLLGRRYSKHARELLVKEPPKLQFEDGLGRVDPAWLDQILGIDINR
ncbi:hypothetical protein COP1_037038 [Malus domestica]